MGMAGKMKWKGRRVDPGKKGRKEDKTVILPSVLAEND
jgi:hypothetical protein